MIKEYCDRCMTRVGTIKAPMGKFGKDENIPRYDIHKIIGFIDGVVSDLGIHSRPYVVCSLCLDELQTIIRDYLKRGRRAE